jgi:hypothetical protein
MDDQLINGMNTQEKRYAKYGILESDNDTDEETDVSLNEDRRGAPEIQTKRVTVKIPDKKGSRNY